MIRRSVGPSAASFANCQPRPQPASGQSPEWWVLISQLDHARLSYLLAAHWSATTVVALQPRAPLLWAIEHHDDGWRDWEKHPDVEPQKGAPRGFTEMELADSLAIWTASIDRAEAAGLLQAYTVAGHFVALAHRAHTWRHDDAQWPAAEAFIRHFESRMAGWLEGWQAENPSVHTPALASLAIRQLQWFDSLSLWFCCEATSEPETAELPGGGILRLTPGDGDRVTLDPWPFDVQHLTVEIPGRAVPRRRYASREELAAAPSQPLVLRWQLEPAFQA